jgi:hypothetical protein
MGEFGAISSQASGFATVDAPARDPVRISKRHRCAAIAQVVDKVVDKDALAGRLRVRPLASGRPCAPLSATSWGGE